MKRIIICIVVLSLISICNKSFAQSDNQIKIKNSFLKTINNELRSLQEYGLKPKNNPEISVFQLRSDQQLQESKQLHEEIRRLGGHVIEDDLATYKWVAFYYEYDNEYAYNIEVSNSIVSPYVGTVTFYNREWEKGGMSKESCLNAPWKLRHESSSGDTTIFKSTLIYAYQEGQWVLVKSPWRGNPLPTWK
ncbi:MAG: hypothetical protein WCF59_05840 [Desulfobaccales bacterium]